MKLDIGAGREPQEGYIPVDKYWDAPGYVQADMWDLPYEDNTVDEIFSSHALEHVPKRMVIPTLAEWYRVLKPGCCAVIAVPDLEWCCREWLERKTNDWWMDIIFGNQDSPGEFHMTGFTTPIMIEYLGKAGFSEVDYAETVTHRQNTLIFRAWKGKHKDVPGE